MDFPEKLKIIAQKEGDMLLVQGEGEVEPELNPCDYAGRASGCNTFFTYVELMNRLKQYGVNLVGFEQDVVERASPFEQSDLIERATPGEKPSDTERAGI